MNAIGVIPARFGSTRFPGKPLAHILGRPLLTWVIEGASSSRKLQEIWVATDDERIAELALRSGAKVAMTDSALPTGTDRVWQAIKAHSAEVIVNIQGDEPLIEGSLLDSLVEPFELDSGLEMATLGRDLDSDSLHSLQTAKIVLNQRSEALYFSRFPLPYSRATPAEGSVGAFAHFASLKHIGIYAYRREFLRRFCAEPPCPIEQAESLEQLRALYLGARIRVVKVAHDSWGVDTPEDVQKIENIITNRQRGN